MRYAVYLNLIWNLEQDFMDKSFSRLHRNHVLFKRHCQDYIKQHYTCHKCTLPAALNADYLNLLISNSLNL